MIEIAVIPENHTLANALFSIETIKTFGLDRHAQVALLREQFLYFLLIFLKNLALFSFWTFNILHKLSPEFQLHAEIPNELAR